jgi:hypothetical protein
MKKTTMRRPIKAIKSRPSPPVFETVTTHDRRASTENDWASYYLNMPDLTALSSEHHEKMRTVVLDRVYNFAKEFPRGYKKVKELLCQYRDISDDELRLSLGQIIYGYRGYSDKLGRDNLQRCIIKAKLAADNLDQFYLMMVKVHHMYSDLALKLTYDAHSEDEDAVISLANYREIPALIKTAKGVMRSLYQYLGYLSDGDDPTVPALPGRPPSRYIMVHFDEQKSFVSKRKGEE